MPGRVSGHAESGQMVRFLIVLGFLALLPAGSAPAAGERVDILRGFMSEPPPAQPHRIDYAGRRYMIQAAGTPVDRRQIIQSKILYADQFPEKAELFRGDMDAFDRMAKQGGVLILLCGVDANAMTVGNMNYLGKRFGFQFAEQTQPGEILPVRVGEGPLGGDIWLCEKGYRPLTTVDEAFAWHYRTVEGTQPVAISRHWGEGFILVMGTTEVNRTSEGRVYSALTLVDWASEAKLLPPPEPTSTPAPPGDTALAPSPTATASLSPLEAAMQRLSGGPEVDAQETTTPLPPAPPSGEGSGANLLGARLAQMREALGVPDSNNPTGSSVLIPPEKRPFFPPLLNARDLSGKITDLSDYRGKVLLVDFWATWCEPCVKTMPQLIEVRRKFRDEGFDILGISLDKSIPSIRALEAEQGMDWRQICDGEGWSSRHVKVLNLKAIPHSYLLDRKGRICAESLRGEALEKAVAEALREQ